jgi:hypothetical protein
VKPRKSFIALTGGLGNQLFQLAATINLAPNHEIKYDSLLGRPRLNVEGSPEVSSYNLPQKVQPLARKRFSWFASKSIGYQLRKGINPKPLEKLWVFGFTTKFLSFFPLAIYFNNFIWPTICSNVGFSEVSVKKVNNLFIGYFQSYRWVSEPETLAIFKNLQIKNGSSELERYRDYASIEHPLIVHIRLGDYVGHNDFGIPDREYFSSAINEILSKGIAKKIWLFSDDLEIAISYLSGVNETIIRLIPEVDNSASTTLEVMRLGKAYVISNSTFSWWGAFLAHESNVEIIAPLPWFKAMPEPRELIPPHWTRRAAWPNA